MNIKRVFCALVVVMFLFGCGGTNSTAELSQDTPDFTLNTPEGNSITMSTFKGDNPILIVFFATWCPPCRREVPALIKMHGEYSGKGLKMLAVNIDESTDRVSGFIRQQGIPYDVVIDKGGEVARLYGVVGIPTAILVDKEGNVRYKGHGLPEDVEEVL